jgi:SAM-dependent methyltransferase
MYILFPGRHHLLTDFQFKYLYRLIRSGFKEVKDIHGKQVLTNGIPEAVIFAVTSANHSNTRRNPLPFYLRAIAIESFASSLGLPSFTFGIDDLGVTNDFAAYTIKKIRHESDSEINLTPENTLVVCSTPVYKMYEKIGFTILPAELEDLNQWKFKTEQPWDIVEKIADSSHWKEEGAVLEKMHPASYELWKKYKLGEKVKLLFSDSIIGQDGDLTETRDYNSYVRQMDEIAGLKYSETAQYIQAGRIGDIGCAVGSWIKLACEDSRFRESDFYGIEVSRHLFDICQQRRHNGEFKNPYVFFAQKNAVTGLVFERSSMNTIFTSSLTHEIESYGSRQDLLKFIRNRYEELMPGGVWVNRDVVGPEDKTRIVLMKLNQKDGGNNWNQHFEDRKELGNYLQGLSTYARFKRFASDYRKKEGFKLKFEEIHIEGAEYIRLTLQDAAEFLTKKDYTDNWQSEMHETFCYWSFSDWKENLEVAGFELAPESHAYQNFWIIDNRFKGKAELFTYENNLLSPCDYPVTNMIVVAKKKV